MNGGGNDDMNLGLIIGLSVAGFIIIVITVVLLILIYQRHRSKKGI